MPYSHVSGIKQHLAYLKSINTIPEPLEYGKSSNVKGQNSLQFQSMDLRTNNQTDTNAERYNEYQTMRTK